MQGRVFWNENKRLLRILTVYLLGIWSTTLFAHDHSNRQVIENKLSYAVSYYLDKSDKLSPSEITSNFYQKRFVSYPSNSTRYGDLGKPLWIKIEIPNTKKNNLNQEFALAISNNNYSTTEFYVAEKETINSKNGNTFELVKTTEIDYLYSTNNLDIFRLSNKTSKDTIFVKYQSYLPGKVSATLNSFEYLDMRNSRSQANLNLWLAAASSIAFLFLLCFINTREIIYLLFFTTFISTEISIAYSLNHPLAKNYFGTLINIQDTFSALGLIFFVLCLRHFFYTKYRFTRLHTGFNLVILTGVSIILAQVFLEPAISATFVKITQGITIILTLLLLLSNRRGNPAVTDFFLLSAMLTSSLIFYTINQYYYLSGFFDVILLVELSMVANLLGKSLFFIAIQREHNAKNKSALSLSNQISIIEESAKSQSEFLHKISHEIRNPLNGILGMTELLLDTALTKTQKEYASTVFSSANNLINIFNDILDQSKIAAGTLELDSFNFELSATITEAISTHKQLIDNKGIEIVISIEQDVADFLKGDAIRLKKIIGNHLENAIQFSISGVIIISVSKHSSTYQTCTLLFQISDSNADFKNQSLKSHISSTINRGPNQEHDNTSITEQLLFLMEGTSGSFSNQNKNQSLNASGNTLWFSAKFKRADSSLTENSQSEAHLDGVKLLVVDDNIPCQQVIEKQGRSWGMQVTSASNGKEALALLRTADNLGEAFDIAVIDHVMPEMDGLQLAQKISQDHNINRQPKIIMLSGKSQFITEEELSDLRILKLLTKPIAGKPLKAAISEVWH